MTDVTTIRASSLDALWECGKSVYNDDPHSHASDKVNTAARIGNAVHAVMAQYVAGKDLLIDDIIAKAELDNEADDVHDLATKSMRAWDRIERFFPQPQVEVVLETDEFPSAGKQWKIAGTADVASAISASRIIIADYKTGWLAGHRHQMHGYAYCARELLRKLEGLNKDAPVTVVSVLVYLRHQYQEVIEFHDEDLDAWAYDLRHNVLPNVDQYRPGPRCALCRYSATCQGRAAVLSGTLTAMTAHRDDENVDAVALRSAISDLQSMQPGHPVTPEMADLIKSLMFKTAMVEQACEAVKNVLRETAGRVGPIDLKDGTALALTEAVRRNLDPATALPVLERHLSSAEIAKCTRLSLTRLMQIHASHQERGARGAARLQLERELEPSTRKTQYNKLELIQAPSNTQPPETPDADPPADRSPAGAVAQG